ncbi:MAG: hypothetical protein AUG51_00225 [Acidobacteria bacterium 13_1_20CM_3_53_8]|nr:MAG: hypothetical protein AUG51_00225 [Acidobacteria bacterium 13_1_20CM_3_53_8]
MGTGKTVTANNISLTNNASGNYVLSSTSAATTADINKATAVVVVAPYTVSYDGSPHTAGVTSITGVNGETGATVGTVNVSNTTHTNAGTYNADTWSFTGTANYNDIASTTITDSISKVDATVVVTPYSVPYDGNPHTATYTINGVNGESGATVGTVTLNTTHTNAGTYNADTWSFTGAGNYNDIASTTITDTISKINATITVTPYDVPYDGAAHTAGSSATGVGGVDLSSLLTLTTTHTNAGTYSADTWSFAGDTNYNSVATTTITDKINKISAHPVVTAYSVPYDGTEHTATAVSDGGVGSFTLIGTKHTSAGDYPSDAWSFDGGTNYLSDSGTVHDAISKIDATITVTPYDVPYNGNSHTASGTATGVGGADLSASLTLTGTTHTNASTYNGDAWSFSGGTNYNNANGTVDDNISKANANCTVTGYSVTYNGSAHTATGSCTGVGGSGDVLSGLDLSGTTHTNAGTYNNDPWSFTAVTSNYNNTNGTVNDSIGKKNAMWTTNANSKYFSANDPSPLTTGSGSGFLAADGVTATYSRTGSPGATLSPVGGYPITATLSATGLLSNYNITNAGAIFTINPDPTAIAFNGPATASVFNCNQTYSATLTDTITNAGISGVSLTLTIGTQSVTAATNASGVATFTGLVLTDQGNTLPANVPESVSITTSWTVPNTSAPATQTGSFTITQDPNIGTGNTATSLYTGPGFFWTTSPTSSTATLTLNATIRDTGVCLGNITKAKVSFYVSTNDGTSFSPVSNAQNLPVGLVNPLDQTTGTAGS